MALKQRALAVYFVEAVKAKGITLWEAFTAIDSDNNGSISPAELFGGLRWLEVIPNPRCFVVTHSDFTSPPPPE